MLLLSPPGPLVVAPLIYKNLGYDPAKAFTPIGTLMSIPQMLVVNPTVPVKSMRELVAYAKTKEAEAILAKLSARPKVGSPEDFAAFMAAETQKWAAVVKAADIKAE